MQNVIDILLRHCASLAAVCGVLMRCCVIAHHLLRFAGCYAGDAVLLWVGIDRFMMFNIWLGDLKGFNFKCYYYKLNDTKESPVPV
jgi:hypothetical protein